MSTYDRYLGTASGRTFLISTIFALVFSYVAILIPLATYNSDAWYAFLYKDVTLPVDDRFNIWLIVVEAVLLTLFYFFLIISLGSYAEINNRLPSWGEIFFAGVVTLLLSYFLPQISVGDVAVSGGSGYHHFTPKMQIWVFVGTLLGTVLMTVYMYYSGERE